MSRIGKKPVQIPAGVTVTVENNLVSVKGPKGELSRQISDLINVEVVENEAIVTAREETTEANAMHGLSRTLVDNMVVGVSKGFEKKLQLVGVGYRANMKGKDLDIALGYSHPCIYKAPEDITFECPDQTHIIIKGISKEQVGQVAAEIRSLRAPEPYKGKGIRYEGEYVRRKLGKAAK